MAGEMKAPNAKEMTGQALQRALGGASLGV